MRLSILQGNILIITPETINEGVEVGKMFSLLLSERIAVSLGASTHCDTLHLKVPMKMTEPNYGMKMG